MTSIHIPISPGKRLREKSRSISISPHLPTVANGVHEKHLYRSTWLWTTTYYIPLPWPFSRRTGVRRLRITLPIPRKLSQSMKNLGRARSPWSQILLALATVIFLWHLYGFAQRHGTPLPPLPFHRERTTRVFSSDDLRRIWEWEVASGHYQSGRKIPEGVALEAPLLNPGLPKQPFIPASRFKPPSAVLSTTVGSGLKRTYLDIQSAAPAIGYPPRPAPGSIADLDIVMDHCDFGNNKYVRDCLEVLRVGAGLDNGNRVRRGSMNEWKYIYVEEGQRLTMAVPPVSGILKPSSSSKQDITLEPPLRLPPARSYWTSSELATACDPDHPRIFHIFWGGPFTSHPFTMILSFLFTQNLGLHLSPDSPPSNICRPQFWVWIQTGLAREAAPKPTALKDMFNSLKTNPWSAPFLHPRFRDIIKFKLWNTTEQLDSIHELKDEWRSSNLFNSGGHVYNVPKEDDSDLDQQYHKEAFLGMTPRSFKSRAEDDVLNRMGSTSSASYDIMRTILSDMARFLLCHRFGGVYLDADTLFLRDWEELWGWKGAFAYRWSRLPLYNTAVLKLNKGSALGTFLIRTALRHGLDFHPMKAISQYIKDADLDGLLLRLPDALFDSPWLHIENYQRDRPPTPSILQRVVDFLCIGSKLTALLPRFADFFATPTTMGGEPQALGFDGFYRGAYSYHWHNHWWMPFDTARNWPDLGPRFEDAERIGRMQAEASADNTSEMLTTGTANATESRKFIWEDRVSDDKRDLDWATVLKRTFESYIRGERPNMYGEWMRW